jgi:hypothetical protein
MDGTSFNAVLTEKAVLKARHRHGLAGGPLPHSVYRIGECRRVRGTSAAGLIGILAAAMLAGCSIRDGVGPFIVDPGHYSVYHCKDFAPKLTSLVTREQELRRLMDRASEGGGGVVIGNLSYRAEYEDVLGEEKVLRRAAAEKNCDLTSPAFQSDQTIR